MQMDLRHGILHRPADLEIFPPRIGRVNAALHADFRCAARPRLADASGDLSHLEIIRPAAQILAHLALGEGAELALERADVGVVDVAGHDIADDVTVDVAPQLVGGAANGGEIIAARTKQLDDLALAQRFAVLRAREHAAKTFRGDR